MKVYLRPMHQNVKRIYMRNIQKSSLIKTSRIKQGTYVNVKKIMKDSFWD